MIEATSQKDHGLAAEAIHLAGFSLWVRDVALFHGTDFSFPAGKWSCLLGTSGVGKSMLLRAMLGLIDSASSSHMVTSGKITTDTGHPLNRTCAYMAQQDLLLPWLSVRANVMIGGTLRGKTSWPGGGSGDQSGAERADELLAAVGLLTRADDLPQALSGGMRQRVALARTLWEDRPVVLMDEPFSALDAISRLHTQDLAARLLTGRTVIMVTHDPLEAIRLADQICILSGSPVQISEPIVPSGPPPRAVDSQDVLALQGRLLSQLRGDGS